MPKLHELAVRVATTAIENSEVTDHVFDILQAAGLRPRRVTQLGSDESVVRIRVSFSTPPTAAGFERASTMLGRFAESSVEWARPDGECVLTMRRLPPQDELEVLGVSSREDSYTSLLGQGLRHDGQLLHRFLRYVGVAESARDWRVSLRPVVHRAGVEEEGGRTKDIPDLVLSSQAQRTLIVVENKVEATEGEGQTDAYSCPHFLNSIARQLGLDESQLSYKLLFLTPDGIAPLQSPQLKHRFEVMTYADLAPLLPVDRADPLGRLLATLRRRVEEQASWNVPVDEADVRSYLRVGWGLVTPLRRLRLLCDVMRFHDLGTVARTGASNNANGPVYYVQVLRPAWERASGSPTDQGWSIHLELQWAPRPGTLTLHLHHETCPYVKHRDLEKAAPLYEAHQAVGDRLNDVLVDARGALKAAGWRLRRYKWSQASHKVRDAITVGELRHLLGQLVASVRPVVDHGITQLGAGADA